VVAALGGAARAETLSMYPRDKIEVGTARPASVGAITQAQPKLHAVLTWPHVVFRPRLDAGDRPAFNARPSLLHEAALQQRTGAERVVLQRGGEI